MKVLLLPTLILVVALILGITFRKSPYQLRGEGQPHDQAALDHRDSPYSHVTWVVSEIGNYAQLRFFDKIEGGICLEPSWAQLQELAQQQPLLTHLVPDSNWDFEAIPGPTWPGDVPHPDPGTLSNTKYTCLYPAGVLMNERLMQAAGGDPRKAAPNVLVVGLGSGIGITMLAHHFPEAAINVVDIDQAVIDMVDEHYPLFHWLQSQLTSDGRPRLQVHAADARQYIIYDDLREDDGRKYDLVILDAYTSGSTIPSHLMTEEYYRVIREHVMAEGGILFSNIIGSYEGEKRYVLAGAIRSMQEAGYDAVWNMPIVYPTTFFYTDSYERPPLATDRARNNIVLASTQPLDPRGARAGWQRLEEWVNYPHLPTDTFLSTYVMQVELFDNGYRRITSAGAAIDDERLRERVVHEARRAHGEIVKDMRASLREQKLRPFVEHEDDDIFAVIQDAGLIDAIIADVRGQDVTVRGWRDSSPSVLVHHTDWVRFARRTWQRCVNEAQDQQAEGYEHDGAAVVGRHVPDAPLYTDAQPNADIMNR